MMATLRNNNISLKKSFLFSVCLHVVLLLVLSVSVDFKKDTIENRNIDTTKISEKPIIKAIVVDEKKLAEAISRQEKQEIAKQQNLNLKKQEAVKIKQEAIKLKQEALKQQKLAKELEQSLLKEKENLKKLTQSLAAKEKKLKAEQDKALKQKSGQQTTTASSENKFQIDKESSLFQEIIKHRIYNNRVMSSLFTKGLKCKFSFKITQDGSVKDIVVINKSGNNAYDSMAEASILKSQPFPVPEIKGVAAKMLNTPIVIEFADEFA